MNTLNRRGARTLFVRLLACLLALTSHAAAAELLPLTDFYDTPNTFESTGQAGDLIRSEAFDGYRLPEGVLATRILYGTTSSDANLAASSGVVLVPPGNPPAGGWPIIAWAHGTSGVDRRCAPSLMTDVFFEYRTISTYLERGYAVVATDYAGLGSDAPFAYMDRVSMGWDVANSVAAARKAVPALGQEWLAIGHSAGALAMRGVAEVQAQVNDPAYLGIVAVSGLGNGRAPMTFLSNVAPVLAVNIIESVRIRDPDFNPSDVLTDMGQEFAEQIKTACSGPGSPRPRPPQPDGAQVLHEGWDSNPHIDDYFKRDETNLEKYKGPALVFSGGKEPEPILASDIGATKRMCGSGVKLHFILVPEANHISVLGTSIDDQMNWVDGRFAGDDIPENCETVAGL